MAINLKRNWRPAVTVIAAVGSLGLLHCERAKQDAMERRAEVQTSPRSEPIAPAAEAPPAAPAAPAEPAAPAAPSAVGGGPITTEEPAAVGGGPTTAESGTARGISSVEQYLDGKGTEVNRFALEGLAEYESACPYLTQKGVDSVDTLADLMTKHKDVKVSIESFTDSTGSDEANKQLSQRRAEVIKKQLVKCGVTPNRIETVGRGEDNPIGSNDTDDGKAQNRRTEVVIHK